MTSTGPNVLGPLNLTSDPYLEFKPDFAYSYASQLVLNGVIFALLCVLFVHLLFTAQYHYPIAKLNYVLQLSGVGLTLTNVVATLSVILNVGNKQTDEWPYMYDYIFITVPRKRWNTAECVLWYCMEAFASAIVQITHIQFLTLLYPSALEARLIFSLLGPIALASSAMTFASLSSSAKTVQVGVIVRNICNSTLTLLFTTALFIWGFAVNRNRAWRTDGGTAAFGAGALMLAVASTALNFMEVKVDHLSWLTNLLLSIILWQSWLAYWWWVGSGCGYGEVEDMLEKEHEKARKAERRRRKRESKANAKVERAAAAASATSTASQVGGEGGVGSTTWAGLTSSLSMSRRRRRRSGALEDQVELDTFPTSPNDRPRLGEAGSSSYRNRPPHLLGDISAHPSSLQLRDNSETVPDSERTRNITLPPESASNSRRPRSSARGPSSASISHLHPPPQNHRHPTSDPTTSSSTSSSSNDQSSTSYLSYPTNLPTLLLFPITLISFGVNRLGRAHEEATKRRARGPVAGQGSDGGRGEGNRPTQRRPAQWGMGQFGLEEARNGEGRMREARRRERANRLVAPLSDGEVNVSSDEDDGGVLSAGDEEIIVEGAGGNRHSLEAGRDGFRRSSEQHRGLGGARRNDESEWVDEEVISRTGPSPPVRTSRFWSRKKRRRNKPAAGGEGESSAREEIDGGHENGADREGEGAREGRGSGWSWWGPLREYRLKDRTNY